MEASNACVSICISRKDTGHRLFLSQCIPELYERDSLGMKVLSLISFEIIFLKARFCIAQASRKIVLYLVFRFHPHKMCCFFYCFFSFQLCFVCSYDSLYVRCSRRFNSIIFSESNFLHLALFRDFLYYSIFLFLK